jgi:lipid-A-disaccharide synthase
MSTFLRNLQKFTHANGKIPTAPTVIMGIDKTFGVVSLARRQVKELDVAMESRVGTRTEERVDLVVVAGEHSGDQHAARVVRSMVELRPRLRVAAFGGPALRETGAELIVDTIGLAAVGIYDVLANAVSLARLLRRVFLWIRANRPRTVCLVDYPGFNLRLARLLFRGGISKKAGGDVNVLYYISPQIWAWKPKRRHQMAKFIDGLGTIFPFEGDAFADTKLDVSFVGHPFAEAGYELNVSHNPDGPILLLPGSRKTAVRRIFPPLMRSFDEIIKADPSRMAVVVYPDEEILGTLRRILHRQFPDLVSRVTFVEDGNGVEAGAAIMSSGTMSLRCCLAGIPGAIVYRAHPLTYAVGRMLVRLKFLGIANILLGRCVWNEFLQSRLRPKSVAKHILQCLDNGKKATAFAEAAGELREILSTNRDMAAADWLLASLK